MPTNTNKKRMKMNNELWVIDQQAGSATHQNGLIVAIQDGEAVEILSIPAGVATRELPALLQQAEKAYQSASIQQQPRSSNKPTRPILSLKR